MHAHYTVGEPHWFIRITPALQPIPVSNNLLEPEVDRLCWLRGVEQIDAVQLFCYNHEYDEDGNFYYFKDANGKYSTSMKQATDTPDWRIVTDGSNPVIYTAFARVQEYVLKLIHNDGKHYPMWVVDQAKIFQEKLDEIHRHRTLISHSENWSIQSITLSKGGRIDPVVPEESAVDRIRAHFAQQADEQ